MLELRSVSAGYGSFRALFDVSLEVRDGEAVGVIGRNGAGKTTLMRAISGMIPIGGGELRLDDHLLAGLPAHRIVESGIAHVPNAGCLRVSASRRTCAWALSAKAAGVRRSWRMCTSFSHASGPRHQQAGTLSAACADVRDRARADVATESCDGRAFGQLAPLVVAQVPTSSAHRSGTDRVDRRAERAAGARRRGRLRIEVGAIKLAGTSAELRNNTLVRQAYMGL
jgi:branched-chain amino acid transport system ATP-binding protein